MMSAGLSRKLCMITMAADNVKKPITVVRDLPAVETLLQDTRLSVESLGVPRSVISGCVRQAIEKAREAILAKKNSSRVTRESIVLSAQQAARDFKRESPVRVINCTGAIAHTNLGRAPFTEQQARELAGSLVGYSALEFNLKTGKRGSRGASVERLLRELTGADGALVVNNCAAAVFLTLNTFSHKKETIVSRGELVQIGGGFRVPAIMSRSGARLVEVGATNITTIEDYQNAIGPKTALLLKVSRSNFTQSGFVGEPGLAELARLAQDSGLPLAYDLGSGLPVDPKTVGLAGHDSLKSALAQGADIVCASGDKLFGSAQAGLILGGAEHIQKLKKNPVYRALRPDKITLSILHSALSDYLNDTWRETIPLWKLALRSEAELYQLGRSIIEDVSADNALTLEATTARYGGGALPEVELPSCAIAFTKDHKPDTLAKRFRELDIPVIGRIEDERFMLDLKAVLPEDEPALVSAIKQVIKTVS